MGMAGCSLCVIPHKHCIMVFRVFVNHVCLYKCRYNVFVKTACSGKVSIYPAHIGMRLGKDKRFRRFRLLILRSPVNLPLFSSKQKPYCFRKSHVVKHLHKINGIPALLRRVIIPPVPTDSNTVICAKSLIPPGAEQFLAAPRQKILQIHSVGSLFLLLSKINISRHSHPFS